MGFLDLKSDILDQDMCARCGACVAICPPGFLTITDDRMPVPAVPLEALVRGLRALPRCLSRERHSDPNFGSKNLRPES